MDSWAVWEQRFNSRFQSFLEGPSSRIEQASLINFHDKFPTSNETHSPSQVGILFDFLRVTEAWEIPLESLRRLPRYLCAMTLLTNGNRVNQGHYEYWRYTGVCASVARGLHSTVHIPEQFEQMPDEMEIGREQVPDWFTIPLTQIELNDFCLLLYLGLLGLQKNRLVIQQTDPENVHSSGQPNLSVEKLVQHSFNLTTRYGFPVLEGLAGKWKQESSSSLQNKLEDWTRNTENDSTKSTLIEVNTLSKIDTNSDIIGQMYDVTHSSINNPSVTFGKKYYFLPTE